MDALATARDAAVQMIDTSVVRVHQHGACIAGNREEQMGRSRGGLTSKIHAVVDADGLPVRLGLTAGEAHDNRLCSVLLGELQPRTTLLADRGYDAGRGPICLLYKICPQQPCRYASRPNGRGRAPPCPSAFAAVTIERFEQRGVGAGELVRLGRVLGEAPDMAGLMLARRD
jgi:hypothetical protein